MEEILNLLQNNARLALEDIAAMTKKTVEEVAAIIAKLENDGVILKYAAIVNPEKDPKSKNLVQAVIEIQVTPIMCIYPKWKNDCILSRKTSASSRGIL